MRVALREFLDDHRGRRRIWCNCFLDNELRVRHGDRRVFDTLIRSRIPDPSDLRIKHPHASDQSGKAEHDRSSSHATGEAPHGLGYAGHFL